MNIKFTAVISSFLLAGIVAEESCKSIKEIVCESDDHKNFCGLISATGTDDVFDEENNLTVFVPNDAAVTSMDFLGALEDEKLEEIVLYHVHKGKMTTDKMECYAGYNTMMMKSGKDSRTICVDFEPTFQKGGGNAKERSPLITSTNIEACNGVVHLLDKVMLPNGYQEYEVAAAESSGKGGSSNGGNSSSTGTRIQQSGLYALAAASLFMYL